MMTVFVTCTLQRVQSEAGKWSENPFGMLSVILQIMEHVEHSNVDKRIIIKWKGQKQRGML